MKIVFITYVHNPTYRSPDAWLKRISGALGIMEQMAKGATIINIHSIGYEGTLRKAEVEYLFFNCTWLELKLPFSLHHKVRKLRPDAVVVRGLIFPLQVILLHWQLGSNVILVAQHHAERPLRSYRKYLQRIADKFIGAYFFASLELGLQWVRAGQIKDQKKIVEAFVVPSTFTPIDKALAKRFTGIGEGTIYLWVGGLDANKDPVTLVKAFKAFATIEKGVKLYLIYQNSDLLDAVQSLVSDCPDVLLVEKVDRDDLLYWYNSADFILSTSHYEGSGVAVCEGISCGCIPIVSNIPSFRWITGNGNLGLLFPPGDEGALLAALRKSSTLTIDEERARVLQHHHSLLSPQANAKKVTDVITSLRKRAS